jgi:o-succinylbenzoate synthase
VKIVAARLHRYRLPLRAEWATTAGAFGWREGWLLRLETADGLYGFGECSPLPGNENAAYGQIAPTAISEALLGTQSKQCIGLQASDALVSLAACRNKAGEQAAAVRCALETALLDVIAQANHVSLARHLKRSQPAAQIAVNAALGSLMMVDEQRIANACDEGFSILKLKVGMQSVDRDIARLKHLSTNLPAHVKLRLDANRAWSMADAEHFIDACNRLPVDMLEEPLSNPSIEQLRRLQSQAVFPLGIDESLSDLDLQEMLSAPPVGRLVLKPPRHGGLLPALALARQASAAGLECIVTSSIDSACGVLAAAHLAAALDNGLAHGLATSSWLTENTGEAPEISNGCLSLPSMAGVGFTPLADHPIVCQKTCGWVA